MLDRCLRWHAAKVIPDKQEDTLITALDELWVSIHGPPGELIMDGESGLMGSTKAQDFLHRKGIKPHQRGKDQHARYIERRGALFRESILKVQSQQGRRSGWTGLFSIHRGRSCVLWECSLEHQQQHSLQWPVWPSTLHLARHQPDRRAQWLGEHPAELTSTRPQAKRDQCPSYRGRLSTSQNEPSHEHSNNDASRKA